MNLPGLNNNLGCSIDDDANIFDNRRRIQILHTVKGVPVPNFDTGAISNTTEVYTVCNALFRQSADRNGQSVRNVRDRTMPVQIEFFNKSDVVVEIPVNSGAKIAEGDIVIDLDSLERWTVTAGPDHSTLRTRLRVGLSRMR